MTGGEELRSHRRCTLIAEFQYRSDSPLLTARVSDISLGGIFVDTVTPPALGSSLTFSLKIPNEGSEVEVSGEGVVTCGRRPSAWASSSPA